MEQTIYKIFRFYHLHSNFQRVDQGVFITDFKITITINQSIPRMVNIRWKYTNMDNIMLSIGSIDKKINLVYS